MTKNRRLEKLEQEVFGLRAFILDEPQRIIKRPGLKDLILALERYLDIEIEDNQNPIKFSYKKKVAIKN